MNGDHNSDGKIRAPFTPAQVEVLNAWQKNGAVHPFTCGNDRGDIAHVMYASRNGGEPGLLVATEKGWVCHSCSYTQDWAHSFMANKASLPNFGVPVKSPLRQFPDIGPDPLQVRDVAPMEDASYERLTKAHTIQQQGVPDQTALVWRIDISRVVNELTWRRCHLPILKQANEDNAALEAKLKATRKTLNRLRKKHKLFIELQR